jgi:hypothetical protein
MKILMKWCLLETTIGILEYFYCLWFLSRMQCADWIRISEMEYCSLLMGLNV